MVRMYNNDTEGFSPSFIIKLRTVYLGAAQIRRVLLFIIHIFYIVGFYVAPTVFQSYSDFQLVSGGGKPQRNLGETTDLPQASWIASSHDKFLPSVGLELAAVRGK